jgi:hypothetical protein
MAWDCGEPNSDGFNSPSHYPTLTGVALLHARPDGCIIEVGQYTQLAIDWLQQPPLMPQSPRECYHRSDERNTRVPAFTVHPSRATSPARKSGQSARIPGFPKDVPRGTPRPPNIQRKDGNDMPEATWKPHEKHGQLTTQSDLPDSVYAFPKQRKEPLTDAEHVRNAVARFDQVTGVSDSDRALAFANIEKAAQHYGVNLRETSWHDLGTHPQKK